MRVLLFFPWGIETLGGPQISVLGLAEALGEAGHPTCILELSSVGKTQKRLLPFTACLWSIPSVTFPSRWQPRSWASFLQCTWRFRAVVREFKPDVVSVQFPIWQAPPVIGACIVPHRWRLVVTVHGGDVRAWPRYFPQLQLWQPLLFRQADAVVAVSQSLLADVIRQYPFVSGKAHVIHNGVDPAWSETSEKGDSPLHGRYVLYVGRLHSIKGVDVLLRAWQFLQPLGLGVTLCLVGDGPELNSLRALSEHLGVASSVRFIGRKPQRELPPLYRSAQLVVIPSRIEGLPLVALEAGACGAIYVATDVGGISEVIEDAVTGFLVKPESPTALAHALLHALRLPEQERKRMGSAAMTRVALHFSRTRMVSSYIELLQSVIQGSGKQRALGNS